MSKQKKPLNFIKELFGAQDMTVGSPTRVLATFSIPLLIGNIAQLLYSTVDSIVVGNFVGDEALAAVGASGPIINLLLLVFMGVSMGSSIMVAQYFGAKDQKNLSGTVGTTITVAAIVSVVMMIAGPLLSPWLLNIMNTPEDIYAMSEEYLVITFLGIAAPAFYNMLSSILRGMGDALYPLIFLLVACGINIVLDLWFVISFGWGVAGVAWATIIAQAISAILCLIRILKMQDTLKITAKTLVPRKKLINQLIRLGLPSGATQGIFSLAALVVQSLTNSFGYTFIAVTNVVMKVDSFAMMPNFTFGTAMTTYTGQNIGAGKMDRVEKGVRKGLKMGLIVSAILVLCLLFFGETLMSWFTDTPEIVTVGTRMIRILAVGYLAFAITQILSGVMRGAGETMMPMWISIIATVIVRVPIAYGIAAMTRSAENPNGLPESIYISLLISWVVGSILTIIVYMRGKWKKHGITQQSKSTEVDVPEKVQTEIIDGEPVQQTVKIE